MFNYKATVLRVIDGDTVKLKVDLGFRVTFTDNFRLAGINTPETRGAERLEGLKAKAALEAFFAKNGSEVILHSKKHGKYRWLGILFTKDKMVDVNSWLVKNGYAVTYEL